MSRTDYGPKGCAGVAALLLLALVATGVLTACEHRERPSPGLSECLDEQGGLGC
jgi:hypothetical protein